MVGFFSPEDEEKIIQAIKAAELNTSGEIRVHLHKKIYRGLMRDAKRAFKSMGMHKTEARNGVLIFIVPSAKKFAILGDEGIDDKVPANFWESTKDKMQGHFRNGDFVSGLCEGITEIGQQLKTFFPYQQDDINELPDEISYGE